MKYFLCTCLVTYISLGQVYAEEIGTVEKKDVNSQELVPLFLISSVNGSSSNDLIQSYLDSKNQKILIKARDLRKLRIKLPVQLKDEQLIALNDIKDLVYSYNENEQTLQIKITDKNLQAYKVDLKGNEITEDQFIPQKGISTVLLNYEINNTYLDDENYFSAIANAIYNSSYGSFSSGFLHNQDTEDSNNRSVRLESKWQYIDAKKNSFLCTW